MLIAYNILIYTFCHLIFYRQLSVNDINVYLLVNR